MKRGHSDLYSDRHDKYFDMFDMLGRGEDSGKLYRIDKVKLSYRYKQKYIYPAEYWMIGYKQNTTKPILLCRHELTDHLCKLEPVTSVLEIKVKELVADIEAFITHAESLQEVVGLQWEHEVFEIPVGITATAAAIECSPGT